MQRNPAVDPISVGELTVELGDASPSEVLWVAAVDHGADLPTLPTRIRSVSHRSRHVTPLRLRSACNKPQVLALAQFERLLAPDQHLLERLHGQDRLLPCLFQ